MKQFDPYDPDYPQEYDELFENAFEKATDALPLRTNEDKRNSWLKIQARIQHDKNRRNRHRKYRLVLLATASMFIGGILFSQPLLTQAVSPIYQKMTHWGSDMNIMVFGSYHQGDDDKAKTPPPPDITEELIQEVVPPPTLVASGNDIPVAVSLKEASNRLPFQLPEITYVPERFSLDTVELMVPSIPTLTTESVNLSYYNRDGEQLRMIFQLIHENETISMITDDQTIELKLHNDRIAYYSPGEFSSLTFTFDNVLAKVFGNTNEEELLQIANGFK
ncbi:hypothetical protein [Paenibacillus segetis]|uniref:DUF4367 domain-containing protein n=1 Tax=Paenibacillus segetis TaxID=1325360 RepID=A0ABQ1YF18_9BACL|nr:hypothetical protein [Paenibacillus segetis]GGH22073.1 hypothetical protein GCM10008013_20330 [Paenibacillus segetis]